MKLLTVFLLLSLTAPCAFSQQSSQPPLSEHEKRTILLQLIELEDARRSIAAYVEFVKRDAEQDTRSDELAKQALALKDQEISLVRRELTLAIERAEMYKQLYEAVTKKRGGIGCFLKKLFTLGIARCG